MILPITRGPVLAGDADGETMMNLALRERTQAHGGPPPPPANIHRASEERQIILDFGFWIWRLSLAALMTAAAARCRPIQVRNLPPATPYIAAEVFK
jgi:hypothetical protein